MTVINTYLHCSSIRNGKPKGNNNILLTSVLCVDGELKVLNDCYSAIFFPCGNRNRDKQRSHCTDREVRQTSIRLFVNLLPPMPLPIILCQLKLCCLFPEKIVDLSNTLRFSHFKIISVKNLVACRSFKEKINKKVINQF